MASVNLKMWRTPQTQTSWLEIVFAKLFTFWRTVHSQTNVYHNKRLSTVAWNKIQTNRRHWVNLFRHRPCNCKSMRELFRLLADDSGNCIFNHPHTLWNSPWMRMMGLRIFFTFFLCYSESMLSILNRIIFWESKYWYSGIDFHTFDVSFILLQSRVSNRSHRTNVFFHKDYSYSNIVRLFIRIR